MSQVLHLHSPLPAPAAANDAGAQPSVSEPPLIVAADVAASELLVQLGHEYFCVHAPATSASTSPHDQSPPKLDPKQIAESSPPMSKQRDFWEEVARASEKAPAWSPNVGGFAPSRDPVAYAIASVSASYTLAASDVRPLGNSVARPQHQQVAIKEPSKPSNAERTSPAANSEPDLADVLASLFGLEEAAGLECFREMNPDVFTRSRDLAAQALMAATVNRNAALKAAQGRKG